MTEIRPCPICGSSAKIDSTSATECYGLAWQTLYIECTREKDPTCGMELSLLTDAFYVTDSDSLLIECWNNLGKKK